MPARVIHMMLRRIALLLGVFSVLAISPTFGEKDIDCGALKRNLAQKRQQLSEHVDALKKLNERGELIIMGLVTQRIQELVDELTKLQEQGGDCPELGQSKVTSGLDSVKSDAGEYATLGCNELRKVLFQLLQKTNTLKRRQDSLFSALSPAEKTELQEAEQSLKEVQAAIKTKCASEPKRTAPRLFHRR